MNFIDYCIATKNYSTIDTINNYVKLFNENYNYGKKLNQPKLPDTTIMDVDNDKFIKVKDGIKYHIATNKAKKALAENYSKKIGKDATYEDWKKEYMKQLKEADNERIRRNVSGENNPPIYKYGKKI